MRSLFKKRLKGYVTVYLALLLGVLLPVFLFLLESVGTQTCKLEAECVTDMALDSAFAEYNRALLERYDLFFIDCAYGSGMPSWHRTETQIKEYLDRNFHPEGEAALQTVRLTAMEADFVSVTQAALATDEGGNVLKCQAVSLEKEMTGATAVQALWSWASSLGGVKEEGAAREGQKEEAYGQMEESRYQKRKLEEGKWEEAVLATPADSVDTLDASGLLRTALGGKTLSQKAVAADSLVSHRTQNQGTGLLQGESVPDGPVDKAFFTAYILDHFGCFGEEREDSACAYQIEYILKGKDSDRRNLEAVCRDIFLIRYGMNMGYLLQDGAKTAEAEEVAGIAAALIWHPELTELIKTAILFGWGYAEGVQDLRILLNGDKLPFVKDADSWQIALTELPFYKSRLGSYSAGEEGNTYRDYLTAFLLLEKAKQQNQLVMDMMEADIQLTKGNAGFRLDGCIGSLTAQVQVSGRYGGKLTLERDYRYE